MNYIASVGFIISLWFQVNESYYVSYTNSRELKYTSTDKKSSKSYNTLTKIQVSPTLQDLPEFVVGTLDLPGFVIVIVDLPEFVGAKSEFCELIILITQKLLKI